MHATHTNTDSLIKEMLSGAEVRPPRSAWRSVSAKLDAASIIAGRRHSYQYALWAFAGVAASLLLGLFLWDSVGSSDTVRPSENVQYALLSDAPQLDITLPQAKDLTFKSRKISGNNETEGKSAAAVQNEAGSITEPSKENSSSKQQQSKAPSHTTKRESYFDWQQWSQAEGKSQKAKKRSSIYAKGILIGNESGMMAARPIRMMAPGTASEGFTESGDCVYGVPFTLGLGVRFRLSQKLSLGTGLDYSLLTRSFSGKYYSNNSGVVIDEAGSVMHTLHYVGIPVSVYFDVLSSDKLSFYAYATAETEYCVSNRYTLLSSPDISKKYPVRGVQFSAGGGVGVEFKLSQKVGLYLDPGVRYYFASNQPRSIRTDKPLLVNFDAGIRFNF